MKNKLNNIYLGLIAGFLFPLISMLVLRWIKYNRYTLNEYIEFLNQINVLTKVLSLSVLPNLLIFFVFIWTNKLLSARGVLMATIIFTALIIGIKFIF